MRKAGDLIAQMLRNAKNEKNKRNVVGSGEYGVVFESDTPGYVIKEARNDDEDFTREADFQSVAADMGFAPRVSSVTTSPFNSDSFEMQDVRVNFEMPPISTQWPTGKNAIRVNQQLGQLALKGIDLDDRHVGNIVYNKMTGRPMQLDFGRARNVAGEDQVAALANATEAGLTAAGLGDVAQIYRDTVYDLLAGGDVADAMDVAKQGFSRLQKIKEPILS
tara:strand:- start:2738 stop:3397 length:660 start_codon:yes stop_codon:yes gene_type:complete